jgi:hypothetical protein
MRIRALAPLLTAGLLASTAPVLAAPSPAGAATTSRAADEFSTARRHVTRTPRPAPLVTAIRVGHHPRFDRVTVTLRGGAPGFDVRYVRRLHQEGSGRVVDLLGPASLELVLLPASGHDPDTGVATLTGPLRRAWRLDQLRETAVIGDFEAIFNLGVGLHRRAPFRVLTLHGPTRIVVDVRH